MNKFQGRDHWTNAYSIVFAGAGVRGGQIIGATDKEAGQVVNEPHTPEEYAAIIDREEIKWSSLIKSVGLQIE